MRAIRKILSLILLSAVTLTVLPAIEPSGKLIPTASATAVESCGNVSAGKDLGDIVVRPVHGKGFYTDLRNGINAGYAGFEIKNESGATLDNLWIGINNFRSGAGSSVLSIANPNESYLPVGRLANNATGHVYFLIKATNISDSAQQQDITVYLGDPNAGGSIYNSGYKCYNQYEKVKRTLSASANKVNQITTSSNPKLGELITVTVSGNPGQVGAGDSSLDGKSIIISPASRANWPSHLLRLESVEMTLYEKKKGDAGKLVVTNRLIIPNATYNSQARYVAVYKFRILGSSNENPEIKPIADIASGTQMKHTGRYPSTSAYLPLKEVSRDIKIIKTVDSTYAINKVDNSFRVQYKITMANSGSSDVTIDELVDLPHADATLVSNTVQVKDKNRTSFTSLSPAPSTKDANGYYRFSGPYLVAAQSGATPGIAELIYIMDLPIPASGSTSYSNKAFGFIGSSLVGSSETDATVTNCSLSISSDSTYTAPGCADVDVPNQPQTITFNQPPAQGVGTTYELDATATSGLPVSYSVRSGPCVLEGNTVLYKSEGSCVIVASQSGDAYYEEATSVIRSVTINPGQFITYENPTFVDRVTMNKSTTKDLVISATSSLPVTLTAFDTTICKIGSTAGSTPSASYTPPQDTNTFKITSYSTSGQCILTATQDGGEIGGVTYGAATPVENIIYVGLAPQFLSNHNVLNNPPTDQPNTSSTTLEWQVRATNSANAVLNWSSIPTDFDSLTPLVCAIGEYTTGNRSTPDSVNSSNTNVAWKVPVDLLKNGLCILEANHVGGVISGVDYAPADPFRTSFNIGSVPTVTITPKNLAGNSITNTKSGSNFKAEVIVQKPGTGSTAPTGTVTLYASGDSSSTPTQVGTVSTKVTDTSSSFTFDLTSSILPAGASSGSISLFATFTSSGTYADSQTESSVNVGVYSPAAVTITRSATSIFKEDTATITVSVSGNSAYGTPAGNVTLSINDAGTITDPASSPFTKTLSSGSATFTVRAGTDITKDMVVDASYVPTSPSDTYFSEVANSSTTLTNRTIDIKERTYSYTIIYNANGGSGTIGNQTGDSTSVTLLPNSFTRTAHVFSHWNTESNGSGVTYTDQQLITLNSPLNLTLYAIWIPIYTINFDANGGIGAPSVGSVSGQSGSTVALAAKGSLEKDGHIFSGWTVNPDGTGDYYSASSDLENLRSSFTLFAKWDVKLYRYDIIYKCNFVGCETPDVTQSDTNKSSVTLIDNTFFTRTDYTFAGWSTTTGGSIAYANQEILTLTQDLNLTLYAIWRPVPDPLFTVTFNPNGATGLASPASAKQTVSGGTVALATVENLSRPGFKFIGWSENSAANGTEDPSIVKSVPGTYTPISDTTLYAIWQVVYTVTFDKNGGTGSPSALSVTQASQGAAVMLASQEGLTREGFAFGGWNTQADGLGTPYAESSSLKPSNNLTLYAKWTPNIFTYSITYNPNTGSGTSFTETGSSSMKTLSPLQFSKSGHVFRHWASDSSGASPTYTNNQVLSLTENITLNLYAIWDPVYTVTFDVNGGSGAPTVSSATQSAFKANIRLAGRGDLALSGYSFGGWSASNIGTGPILTADTDYEPTSNIVLFAVWNLISYTITYNLNGGSGNLPTETNKTTGQSFNLASGAGLTKDGYTFAGWNDGTSTKAAGDSYTVSSSNVTLTAQWTSTGYTIIYNLNGGSGTLPTETNKTTGQSFNLASAPTRTGYTFAGWNDGTSTKAAGDSYTVGSSNVTLTAQWTAINYTITYLANGASGVVPTETSKNIDQSFNLASGSGLTKDGYTFAGWSDGSSTKDAGAEYTVGSNNVTLTAQWTANSNTITYDSQGGSSVSNGSFNTGGSTTLASAPTRNGYTFLGWFRNSSGGSALTSPYSPDDTSNITLYAQWTEIVDYSYSIEFNANGGSGSMDQLVGSSASVTLSQNLYSRSNFTFQGWSTTSSGSVVYTDRQVINLTGNLSITLYAVWIANPTSGGNGTPITNTTTAPTIAPTPSPTRPIPPRNPRTPNIITPTTEPVIPLPRPTNTNPGNSNAASPTRPDTPATPNVNVPDFTIDLGAGMQNLPSQIMEIIKLQNISDPVAVLEIPEVKKMVDDNKSMGSPKRSIFQFGSEKLPGFSDITGMYIEVVGSRAAGQFVVSPAAAADPVALSIALKESVDRNRTNFAWIEQVRVVDKPDSLNPALNSIDQNSRKIFAESKLADPISLSQVSIPSNAKWISISANVNTYKPGSEIYLAVTTQPIIFGVAVVDEFGKAEISGEIPIQVLSAGAHTLRIVGTRNIEGVGVSENGEISLSPAALREINMFDLGTQATVTVVGKNSQGGDHLALREIPIEMPVPWWTLWIVAWTAFIFIILKLLRKISLVSEKLVASVITVLSSIPAFWFGWTYMTYFIMWSGFSIAIMGALLIWLLPPAKQKADGERNQGNPNEGDSGSFIRFVKADPAF